MSLFLMAINNRVCGSHLQKHLITTYWENSMLSNPYPFNRKQSFWPLGTIFVGVPGPTSCSPKAAILTRPIHANYVRVAHETRGHMSALSPNFGFCRHSTMVQVTTANRTASSPRRTGCTNSASGTGAAAMFQTMKQPQQQHRGRILQRRGAGGPRTVVSLSRLVLGLVVTFTTLYLGLVWYSYSSVFVGTSSGGLKGTLLVHNNNKNNHKPPFSRQERQHKDPDSKNKPTKVAFAVTVTGCGSDPITEGAAVLKHSIHRASLHGTLGGRYDYDMIALYHPSAWSCTAPLAELGYTLMERNVFVRVEDIQGEFLRTHIAQNGCCGEKELIKLEAFCLTEYPIVVHLDLDVLVLKPLDEILDWMILAPQQQPPKSDAVMWPDRPWPTQPIQAMFTMDYNMVGPDLKYKPVQGGFLVLRPNQTVYEEFRDIVRQGDFREREGWGGQVGYVLQFDDNCNTKLQFKSPTNSSNP